MARSSFIPGKDIRILRELTRYLYKVVGIASSEKNRFQNALVVGNLRADMVFSDVFGKSASSVVDLILSNDDVTDKEILSKVHPICKASNEEILEATTHVELTSIQKSRIKLIRDHYDYLQTLKENLSELIQVMIEPYESFVTLCARFLAYPENQRSRSCRKSGQICRSSPIITAYQNGQVWHQGRTHQQARRSLPGYPEQAYTSSHVW